MATVNQGPEPPDSEEGAVLDGRYRLGGIVGSGEHAVVREARDLRGERNLAVKMLRPAHARSPAAVARMDREILIQSRLSWPALTLYDRGVSSDGRPYYVVDLAPGVTVAEILDIRGGKRLSLEPALWIAADVAMALHHARSSGIVHGNVCPAKILLSKRSSLANERALLVDFSRGRIVDLSLFERHPGETDSTYDPDPPPGGAPPRLFPEDVMGKKKEHATDVFGLGALLFELIAGPLPAMEEILGGWKPREALDGAVPIQIAQILQSALDPRPEARCLSAYDVFVEIMRVIERIHPPSAPLLDDPGPAALQFRYNAMRPTDIDWRLNRATA